MKNSYVLCDYSECPLKECCARYLENLDRKTTAHFASMPYNQDKAVCKFYIKDDEDYLQQLNVTSND